MTHESNFVSLAFDASHSTIQGFAVFGQCAILSRHVESQTYRIARMTIQMGYIGVPKIILTFDSEFKTLEAALIRFDQIESEFRNV